MLRSNLPALLRAHFPQLQEKTIEKAVDVLIKAMQDAIANGSRIEFRGFGSFDFTHTAARIGRNPKTGESVAIPARLRLNFKPGKELKKRVDANWVAAPESSKPEPVRRRERPDDADPTSPAQPG
jgi:integration host factor subunit beta